MEVIKGMASSASAVTIWSLGFEPNLLSNADT
jgi:hypothetical protein